MFVRPGGKLKTLKRILFVLISVTFLAAVKLVHRLIRSKPRISGEISMQGLRAPVKVLYDKAGVPHVFAENDEDGLKALGYIVAQDRLFQMDIMRRIASGTLSEFIGFMGVDIDRFMRTIGLRELGHRFSKNVNEETLRLVNAYVEGVNAFINLPTRFHPVEYMILGTKPRPWKIEDAFTIGIFLSWMLDATWPADIMREKIYRKLGKNIAKKILPATSNMCVPVCRIDGDGCKAEPLDPGEDIDWEFEKEPAGGLWIKGKCRSASLIGSNNWVVGCSKSITGKPILCSDPHIEHMVPSTLYISHLHTPSFNVIGAGFVGIPIVGIGHNERCAWGVTSFDPDLIDLFVERFESADSEKYLYKGEWLEAESRIEEIKVRFGRTKKLKVLKTIHGPIIKRKGDRGLALKWTGMDTSFDILGPFLRMNASKNWSEFREALRDYLGPAFNFVYADVEGNIAYQGAAKVPLRASGDGSIPCPGHDGSGDWTGYIPFDEMPTALNPPEDWIATANNCVVSEGYPHLITTCWGAPYRQARIAQLLQSEEKLSIDSMKKIQADVFTIPGKVFSEWVKKASERVPLEGELKEAADLLAKWDFNARKESVATTIYYFGMKALSRNLFEHRLGSKLYEEYSHTWINLRLAVENIVSEEDPYWLDERFKDYNHLIIESLKEGVEEIKKITGTENMNSWEWGRIHTLSAFHPLGLFWPLTKIFNVGPVPRDGESETVDNALTEEDPQTQLLARGSMGGSSKLAILPDPNSAKTYAGPLCRFIADLSDWDNSLMVLDVGQSGHILSPHYKDHFEKWNRHEYFRLEFSKIEPASILTIKPS